MNCEDREEEKRLGHVLLLKALLRLGGKPLKLIWCKPCSHARWKIAK